MALNFKKIALVGALSLAIPFSYAQAPWDMSYPQGKHAKKTHKKAAKHRAYAMAGAEFFGVQLSQQQDDEIFKLRHNAEPKMREKRQNIRQLEEELFLLKNSDKYTLNAAKEIQKRISQARADLDLMRVELDYAVFNVLTPEQKAQTRKAQAMWNAPVPFNPQGKTMPPNVPRQVAPSVPAQP